MKKRIVWIDLLRIIGMLSIIMIHVVGNTINTYHLTGTAQTVYHILEKCCYFAIPLFIMLSGMYFLNKDIGISKMLKKYCLKIFLALVVFGSFYSCLEIFFAKHTIDLSYIPIVFQNLLTGNLWAHMWYLYMVLGLYLLTPIFRILTKNIQKVEYRYFLILLYIFSILIPEINSFFSMSIAFTIPLTSGFLFYYLYSAYLIQHDFSLNGKRLSIFLGILSLFYIGISVISNTEYIPITYTSTPVFLIANMFFILFQNKEFSLSKNSQSIISSLGTCSFGIYILHQFYINLIYKVFKIKWILTFPYFGFLLYVGVIFSITYLTVYFLKKIKFVDKYLL